MVPIVAIVKLVLVFYIFDSRQDASWRMVTNSHCMAIPFSWVSSENTEWKSSISVLAGQDAKDYL